MIIKFFFSDKASIRVHMAQTIRNRVWPKDPTLPSAGQNAHGQNMLAKTSLAETSNIYVREQPMAVQNTG